MVARDASTGAGGPAPAMDTGVSAIMGTKTGQQLVLLCSELLPAAAAAAAFKCYWACV